MKISPAELEKNARKFNLNDKIISDLLDYEKEADEALAQEIWNTPFSQLPRERLRSLMGEEKMRLLFLYTAVANREKMEALYAERNYPSIMLDDISKDLALWVEKTILDYGKTGLGERAWDWSKALMDGKVLQFGRLQCELQHEYKGKMCVVERDGRKVFIPVEEKQAGEKLFFAPGDAAINIHIPASGPLKMEACLDSFRRIREFSEERQKEYHWKGFMIYSWILDPFFANFNPESNLAKLQKLGPLYDLKLDQRNEVLWRVFHLTAEKSNSLKDYTLLPGNTSMERAVKDHLQKGGRFSEYAMIVLREG